MANVQPSLEAMVLEELRKSEHGLRPSELTQRMERVGHAADVRRVMERLIDRAKIEVGQDLKMRLPSRSEE